MAQVQAQANPPLESSINASDSRFVGSYRRGSVDTAEYLFVLPDHTYCYTVMAGSLDLLSGGRWETVSGGQGGQIRLQEVKPAKPVFPVLARSNPENGSKLEFQFHGRSLSQANDPVFAVSTSASVPTSMRRLFPKDHNGWAAQYSLPAMDAAQALYFYMGGVEQDEANRKPRLRVYQYELGDANVVRLGYDRIQAMPLMEFTAELVTLQGEDLLELDGRRFGIKKPLSPQRINDARTKCIQPALESSVRPTETRRDSLPALLPKSVFYLPIEAIQDKPWFDR